MAYSGGYKSVNVSEMQTWCTLMAETGWREVEQVSGRPCLDRPLKDLSLILQARRVLSVYNSGTCDMVRLILKEDALC